MGLKQQRSSSLWLTWSLLSLSNKQNPPSLQEKKVCGENQSVWSWYVLGVDLK